MNYLVLIFLLLLTMPASATKQVLSWPSNNPILVCQPSDSNSNCGGASGGSGNVGIGTTNYIPQYVGVSTLGPSNIVIVNGNIGVGTINPVALLNVNSSAAQDLFRVDDSAGSDSTPFIIDQTGNVGIGSANPSAVLAISSTLNQALFRVDDNGTGDLSPFIIDASGNVGIGTTNTEQDRLLVMGGNVGIGTWVPSTKLDVAGSIVVNSGGNIGVGTNLGNFGLSVMVGNVGIGTWIPGGSLQVNTSNRSFLIDNSGNVGIGTIKTTAFIESVVGGNVGIGTWVTNSNNEILNINDSTGNGNGISLFDSGSFVGALEPAGTAAGLNRQFFLDLTSNTSGADNWIAYRFNNASRKWFFGDDGTNAFFQTFNPMTFGVKSSGIPATSQATVPPEFFISTSNVGIFTITGGSSLSVSGNASFGSYATSIAPTGGMIISGNVGLGTFAPIAPLSVTGHIHSHGTAPTVSNNACGTTVQGALIAKSTDVAGSFTVGTLAVTSCAVTFATTWLNAPQCILIDDSNIIAVKAVATTTTLTASSVSSMSSDVISYICIGNE